MISTWVIYVLLAGITSALFNFNSRSVLKDWEDSTSFCWWFEFFRFVIFLPFVIPHLHYLTNLYNLTIFVIVGLSEFLTVYFYMKMHAKSDLSISSVIQQLRLIFIPIIAYFILSERLTLSAYLGIIIILLGQFIVTSNKNILVKGFDIGIKYALIAAFLASINNIVAKPASGIFPATLIPFAMAVPSVFLFPLLMKSGKSRIRSFGKVKWKHLFLISLINAASMVFLVLALRVGEVSRVSALYQSAMIIQVILGISILNERENIAKKVFGSLIILSGIYFLV